MMGQGSDLAINAGRVPRPAPVKEAILRLADGTRTATEIAAKIGKSRKNVCSMAHQIGVAHMLRPASGAPIPAKIPEDVLIRDLSLPPEVARWLGDQATGGVALQDLIRAILIDAHHEETGL